MDTLKKLFADAKFCIALFDAVTGLIFLLVPKFYPAADVELMKQVFFLVQPIFLSIIGAFAVQEKAFAAKIAVLTAQIAAQAK